MVESKDKVIEKFNEEFQQIKDSLENVKDAVLSDEKRKEKVEEIRIRAEKAKEDLEDKMESLKDNAVDEAQTILESLNEIINFKLSI